MIDHLAGRARAIDLHAPGRHAHAGAPSPRAACRARARAPPRRRRRAARPEVRHDRVGAEGQRVGALLAQTRELLHAGLAGADAERDDGRHEARAHEPPALRCARRRARVLGQLRLVEDRVELARDLARRPRPALAVGQQHLVDELVEPVGDAVDQIRQARRRGRHQARERRDRGGPHVRRAAGDELEQRGAERVDVAARVARLIALGLLGRHVRGRPDDGAGLGEADVVRRSHTEVDELGDQRARRRA